MPISAKQLVLDLIWDRREQPGNQTQEDEYDNH